METPTPPGRALPPRVSHLLGTSLASLSASALDTPSSSAGLAPSTSRKRPLDPSLSADLTTSTLRRSRLADSFTSSMSARAASRELYDAQRRAAEADARAEELRVRVERLERDREWLDERERELRARGEREAVEREEQRKREEAEVRRLRMEVGQAGMRLEEVEEELARVRRRKEEEAEHARRKEERLARNLKAAEEVVESSGRRAEEAKAEAQMLRAHVEELEDELASIATHGQANGDGAGDGIAQEQRAGEEDRTLLRSELHRQSAQLQTLQIELDRSKREADAYRVRVQDMGRLQERCRELERAVAEGEGVRAECERLRDELEERKREREELERIISDRAGASAPSAPSALSAHISSLIAAQEALHARITDLSAQTASLQADLEGMQALAEDAQRTLGEERARREEAEVREERERRLREVEGREVGELRALLATYAAEESTEDAQANPPVRDTAAAQSTRILQLEQLVDTLKAESERLLGELNARPAPPPGEGAIVEASSEELARLRDEMRQAEEELEREKGERAELQSQLDALQAALDKTEEDKEAAEQRLFDLGEKIGSGLHVPPGERVLQLASNPVSDHFAVRAQQLDDLRAERDALLSRRKLAGWVPVQSWDAVQREKEALVDDARQREKRMLRLKQVFAAKATEFREAVTSILGYKLNFSGNGRVRLTSIYDPRTALVFQSSDDESNTGSMRLIGVGERAEQGELGEGQGVENALEHWVRQRDSIPCFLAQLTIECYEKTPAGRRAGLHVADGARMEE